MTETETSYMYISYISRWLALSLDGQDHNKVLLIIRVVFVYSDLL